jgi:2-amino-4-hydroxy-6-hydroxymethyldihydropteridine diphosphokinase
MDTYLMPFELLTSVKTIEKQLGRTESEKWSARTIDIDILTFDSICMRTKELIIPHPQMVKRRFVLEPLCDLNDNLVIAGQSETVRRLVEEL